MSPTDRRNRGARLMASVFLILMPALALGLPASADARPEKAAGEGGQILATVDGKPITEADVKAQSAELFARLQREFEAKQHELLEDQLQQAIQDRLLEAEAAARKLGKEQLLAEIKAPEVSDADVDRFYQENKAQIPRPKDEVAGQIKQYLQQRGQAEAQQKYLAALQEKHQVVTLLEPLRTQVAADGPARGPATAPVTIVEFSDFQCPYCSRVVPTLEQVKAKYGDKVRIVFRQFPLSMHPNAQKAAEASLCANEQGRFWEMHDAMFKNQQELAVASLKAKAAALGLASDSFDQCLDSGKYAAKIQADQKDGNDAGVDGTPGMFINGRAISGAVPLEQLITVIDDELKRKGA